MGYYRKKPVVIEAYQWFKNGDHPEDDTYLVTPDPNSTTQFEPFESEGKIVRRYNNPYRDGHSICKLCQKPYQDHGWVDTLEGGHIVCPGDYVIKGISGEYYPCKPDIFNKTYEPVDNEQY